MSNKTTHVMSSISNSFKFASDKVKSNLVEYIRRENIKIHDNDLKGLLLIIESTLDQSFVLTADSIQKSLQEAQKLKI